MIKVKIKSTVFEVPLGAELALRSLWIGYPYISRVDGLRLAGLGLARYIGGGRGAWKITEAGEQIMEHER